MKVPNDLIVRIKCPGCGQEQRTQSLKSKKCFNCGKSITIFPKNNMSRVTYCNDTKRLTSLVLGIRSKW